MRTKETKITFLDYEEEGLFGYNLSQEEGKNPFLISCFEYEEKEYRDYNVETEEFEGEAWYLKDVEKLKEIARFKVEYCKNYFYWYHIYEVVDKKAFLNIWSMASDDFGIAESTISGNSDINRIIESIKLSRYYGDFQFDYSLTSWAYTQNYGGGADEHYAVFYSEEKKYIDFVRKQVEASKLSTMTS